MNVLSRKVSLRYGLLAAAVLLAVATPMPLQAAKPVPSLDIVPANAAFYSVMLRNREQFDAVVKSNAYAKLRALPLVQMGLAGYQMQAADPDSPAGKFEAARRNPEIKKSLKFLADICSDEIFVYGGASFGSTVQLLQGTYSAVQFGGPFMAGINAASHGGQPRNTDVEEIQGRAFVQALVQRVDLIKLPDLVIGFKVTDKAVAKEELDLLEENLKLVLAQEPVFENRLKRATIDGHSYFTLSLDGSMIPWDPKVLAKIRELAPTPEDGEKLIEHLKQTTLVVSVGLRDDYLLLAIGPSTKELTRLGSGAALGSRTELAAVAKYADKRIYSVSYVSKAFNQHFGQTKAGIDNLLKVGKSYLAKAPGPAKLRQELEKDADELAADLKSLVTEIGAMTSIAFLTESGMEGYDYDWSEHPELDPSKPLDLLKHVGGSPIALLIDRSKFSPVGYDMLVKWIGIGDKYLQEYGVPQIPPKERAQFEEVYNKVKPLAGRLDKATRELLIPGLADGQTGLVLDAKFTSHRFIKTLPATEQALTMIEPAIVLGVSDAEKLKQAFEEYYAVADDFVEVLKGIEKSEVPKEFKLPRPHLFHLRQGGTVYGYALPEAWGVDSRFLPNAGLSEKVAVLSLSGKHTMRLLAEAEPKIAGLPLATDRPLASVGGFDFAAFVEALTPWVDLALDKSAPQLQPEMFEMVRQHVKTAMEVLKVYRGTVSETYVEGKITVTHSRTEYHDIAE